MCPAGTCPGRGRPAAPCRCPVVVGWQPRPAPVWWRVEAAVEGGCCRHTGGTGTVAGIADTVDTDAFAGSTPNMTWRGTKQLVPLTAFESYLTDSISVKVENVTLSSITQV